MSTSKFILPGILFLLIIVSGFWVARTAKPYNPVSFNVHKLIALADVVLTVIVLVNQIKVSQTQIITFVLLIIAALSVIALFVSGGLMSALKTSSSIWLLIHRVAPFLLAGSTTAAVLFLLKK